MDKPTSSFSSLRSHMPTRKIVTYLVLIVGAAVAIFPFFWMISTSVMSLGEAQGTRLIPSAIHLENYINAWKEAKFSLYMWNSVRITLITLAGEMVVSVFAAYAFARIRFPRSDLRPAAEHADDPRHGDHHS